MPLTDVQIRTAKPGLRPVRSGKGKKQAKSKGQRSANETILGKADLPEFVKTDKPYKLADEKGLYLEVDPSGGKYWRFKYRFPREKRISLGVYPEVRPEMNVAGNCHRELIRVYFARPKR
jgi:hypothetical protein